MLVIFTECVIGIVIHHFVDGPSFVCKRLVRHIAVIFGHGLCARVVTISDHSGGGTAVHGAL